MTTAIINCTVYTPDEVIPRGLVLVDGAHIVAVGRSADTPIPPHARLIDAAGGRLTPGLIDLVRFARKNDMPESGGVTAYLQAVTVRGERDLPDLARAAAALTRPPRRPRAGRTAARPLGLHVIGPWLPGCTNPPDWHDLWAVADAAVALLTLDPAHAPPGTPAALLAAGARLVFMAGAQEDAGEPAGAVAIRPHEIRPEAPVSPLLATADDDPDLLAALWQQTEPHRFTLSGNAARPLSARSLRELMAATGASFADALPAVTCGPADLLGLPHGRLRPRAPADLLCWTRHGGIAWTMIGGEIVYPF